MRVRYGLFLGIVAITATLCHSWMAVACTQAGPCFAGATQRQLWMSAFGETLLLLIAATLVVWLVRVVWLLAAAARQIGRLDGEEWPAKLDAAVGRTKACRVICIDSSALIAFCAGAWRPRIFVTRALVSQLRADELDAVLLHERSHSRRLDPLRYSARLAAAEVCFYVPLARWWARYQHENAELDADRAALQEAGPCSVAGALWIVGASSLPFNVAAFNDVVELRAAQVLGDALPRRTPSAAVWLYSAIGSAAAVGIAMCLTGLLVALG